MQMGNPAQMPILCHARRQKRPATCFQKLKGSNGQNSSLFLLLPKFDIDPNSGAVVTVTAIVLLLGDGFVAIYVHPFVPLEPQTEDHNNQANSSRPHDCCSPSGLEHTSTDDHDDSGEGGIESESRNIKYCDGEKIQFVRIPVGYTQGEMRLLG